jgi:transcriptional antiterminator Rof (Rho-off)
MTNDYRPIACGLYDQLEVWASHAEPLELEVSDEQGRRQRLVGRTRDLRVREGAEYLLLEDETGGRHELRLDRLLWVRSRLDGETRRQESDAPREYP